MSPSDTHTPPTPLDRKMTAVLDHLKREGFVLQFPREKLQRAIRAETTIWRGDHVNSFIRTMEARGWIQLVGSGIYAWGPRAEEWKPKPAAEAVRADE